MSIPIEYVNRKREVSATDDNVIITFYIKVNQAWAEARENVAVLIISSNDSRIPQVGDSLGDGLKVADRRLEQKVDRVDLYELECECPISLDDDEYNRNTEWGNKRIISIDYDIVEYNVVATQGEFYGTSSVRKSQKRPVYSATSLPLFNFGNVVPIQSSSAEPFDNPLMTTQTNLLIRLTQVEERFKANNDALRLLVQLIGSINSRPIVIAGVEIPEREGMLRNIRPQPKPGGVLHVSYEIEVVIDRPLYKEVLDQGYKLLTTATNPNSQVPAIESDNNLDLLGTDEGNQKVNSPVKLDGSGGVNYSQDLLGLYLLFYPNMHFADWNRTLDFISRVR